ncbi:MAG: carbonic anhydrase [Selenomonadaceae bacterium]|nr:carbonic anhydrase [Selenomonadaceae bacterium]
MSVLDEIFQVNEKFCLNPPVDYTNEDHHASKLPKKHLAIVTCMDTRLVNFLEPALGLKRGDAKIIKTVGNCLNGVFDTTVRSLLVCIYELGVQEIAIIGHYECGMAKTTSESLTKAMISRGVSPDAIKMVEKELIEWADNFRYPEENVKEVVKQLRENPLIPKDVKVHGLMFHPRSGRLELLDRE